MKKLLFICFFLPSLAFAQKGAIQGNVYYIYNENVRNRPDVGARVLLISKDNKQFRQETTVNLQGYYWFRDIEPGEYMVITTSHNTTEDPITSLESLVLYTDFLSNWAEGLPVALRTPQFDSLQIKVDDYKLQRDSKKLQGKKLQAMTTSINDQISAFYSSLPVAVSERLDLKSPHNKMKFEVIKVPAKEINVVTDFGLLSH